MDLSLSLFFSDYLFWEMDFSIYASKIRSWLIGLILK